MINRDNVIMQLDNLQRFLRNYNIEFFSNALDKGAYADHLADAITLLKEQEAVYPSWQNGKMYCGHCGSKFPPRVGMRFCHRCGVPIKLKVNDIVKHEGR